MGEAGWDMEHQVWPSILTEQDQLIHTSGGTSHDYFAAFQLFKECVYKNPMLKDFLFTNAVLCWKPADQLSSCADSFSVRTVTLLCQYFLCS